MERRIHLEDQKRKMNQPKRCGPYHVLLMVTVNSPFQIPHTCHKAGSHHTDPQQKFVKSNRIIFCYLLPMYLFPRAAIINYLKFSGHKAQKLTLSKFWRTEV